MPALMPQWGYVDHGWDTQGCMFATRKRAVQQRLPVAVSARKPASANEAPDRRQEVGTKKLSGGHGIVVIMPWSVLAVAACGGGDTEATTPSTKAGTDATADSAGVETGSTVEAGKTAPAWLQAAAGEVCTAMLKSTSCQDFFKSEGMATADCKYAVAGKVLDDATLVNWPGPGGDIEACKTETVTHLDCRAKLAFDKPGCQAEEQTCDSPAAAVDACLKQHTK